MANDLNKEQKMAVEAPQLPLLIIAGAGTGKTRVLTQRIAYLIKQGMAPERICAVTFTNKAAKEMEERVALLTGEPSQATNGKIPLVSTFHSLGARILRKEARHLGRTAGFLVFDAQDSASLIKRLMKEHAPDVSRKGKEGLSLFASRIRSIKEGDTDSASLLESPFPMERMAGRIYEHYECALQEHNAFDFDDLLSKVIDLFRKKPEILAYYQSLFDHVLVDEYQDINKMQYELIRFLAKPHGRLSVVGDAAQTIYTWRGSNINIFLSFARDWPGSQTVALEENYRSSGHIIGGASAIIAGHHIEIPGASNLRTSNPQGEKIHLREAKDERDEALHIARAIKSKPAPSTAILYRTNAQSRAIEEALIELNIPYRIFGGLRFYERREIKDVLAGIRYAFMPQDSVSRERLEKAFGKRSFAAFVPMLQNIPHDGPAELIQFFLDTSHYLALLEKEADRPEERRENIVELIRFAKEFEDVPSFLEKIALLGGTDDSRTRDRSAGYIREVQLMTGHLAKGLEFDRVFVAGICEGILPHGRSFGSADEIEEERRLLYVAMTRARKELFLSFYDIPSRFLSELPEEHLLFENGNRRLSIEDLANEDYYLSID